MTQRPERDCLVYLDDAINFSLNNLWLDCLVYLYDASIFSLNNIWLDWTLLELFFWNLKLAPENATSLNQ